MKKNILFLLLIILIGQTKSKAQFTTLVEELKANITTVTTNRGTYEQSILEKEPGIISITNVYITTKGLTKTTDYEVSVSDIDIHMVKEFAQGDLMYVQLKISQNQKFIKVIKDGEASPYSNLIKINATDIDNARVIRDIIKKMIPLAKEIQNNRINAPSYDDKMNFLIENITEVNDEKNTYKQALSSNKDRPGSVSFELIKPMGKSVANNSYTFNLADLNENSVQISVQGTKVSLKLEILRGQKLVQSFKEQEQASFVSTVTIYANSIDQARDLSTVFKKIIPEAKEKVKKSMPQASTVNEMITILNENIDEVTVDGQVYKSSYTPTCITSLSSSNPTKSGTIDYVYTFNFSDLNEHKVDYKISGKMIRVAITTQTNANLIKEEKNEESISYKSSLSFPCKGTDEARIVVYLLEKIIENCRANPKRMIPEADISAKTKWLSDNISEVKVSTKVYQQSFSKSENDPKKFEFKSITSTKSSSIELLYEFNIADINPRNVKFDISGRSLSVKLETNYNSKVIKTYKNGETGTYLSSIQIFFDDVETARNAILGFQEIIEELAK